MATATEEARRKVVDARAALVLVRKLVAGVARLHEQDLAHYDLKPENILIVEGEPKIGDVGLVGPLEAAPAHSGTPLYMTPQGAADDLYALGRILYELVSGRPSGDFPRLPAELVSAPTSELFYKAEPKVKDRRAAWTLLGFAGLELTAPAGSSASSSPRKTARSAPPST